jgi:hypothetical protein
MECVLHVHVFQCNSCILINYCIRISKSHFICHCSIGQDLAYRSESELTALCMCENDTLPSIFWIAKKDLYLQFYCRDLQYESRVSTPRVLT